MIKKSFEIGYMVFNYGIPISGLYAHRRNFLINEIMTEDHRRIMKEGHYQIKKIKIEVL